MNFQERYYSRLIQCLLLQVEITQDYFEYQFTNLIAEVGGYLGLLLGASLYTVEIVISEK